MAPKKRGGSRKTSLSTVSAGSATSAATLAAAKRTLAAATTVTLTAKKAAAPREARAAPQSKIPATKAAAKQFQKPKDVVSKTSTPKMIAQSNGISQKKRENITASFLTALSNRGISEVLRKTKR